MKKIAVIIAGGVGARMGANIPKQFINIYSKPVIVYTMEAFQKHRNIDSIVCVCVDGWSNSLQEYAKQYNITKLESIVPGGKNGQESIKNGILEVKRLGYNDNDIVLIHDAIRPMISEEMLSENIEVAKLYGNATTVVPCTTVVLEKNDNDLYSTKTVDRAKLFLTQTPQAFKLGDILSAHEEAYLKGITSSLASCDLYAKLGRKVYYSPGSETNIKLTRPGDLEIFKALVKCEEFNNENIYNELLDKYTEYNLNWDKLKDKTIMISGVTGLIGKFLTDLIMMKNEKDNLNCTIVGLCRKIENAKVYFRDFIDNKNLILVQQDVSKKIKYDGKVDYVIHAASNTHPIQYATDPIGTIKTNVYGTNNLLEYSKNKKTEKFLLISSFEVYGETDGLTKIGENDYGVVDQTVLRSCYPESKRLSESLTIAYSNQENIDISIVRLSRVFGPTMQMDSSLATAQFIKNASLGEDIVLKSDGMQLYSYNFVGDAVTAILTILINGKNREAYNVSDSKYDLRLNEFAKIAAESVNKRVIYELPNEIEKKGFSNSVMTILDGQKLHDLGWTPMGNIEEDINTTISILKYKKAKDNNILKLKNTN